VIPRRRITDEALRLRGKVPSHDDNHFEHGYPSLVITRETVDEVLSEADAEASPAAVTDGTVPPPRSGHLPAAWMLAVPERIGYSAC
jgi:hypothetical protein